MVLGVAALAQALAPRPFEVEAGGIHEHHRQLAEQIAAALEQALLHQVLDAARRERRAIRLLRPRQLLAEPAHGAVQMMQGERLGAVDPVVLTPGVGGPIGARDHDPVQHGQEAGALQRETEATLGRQVLDHRSTAGLAPESFEDQGRPDAPGGERRHAVLVDQREDHGALGEARRRARQPVEIAPGRDLLLAAEVLDDPLLGAPTLAHALDQVDVAVRADRLLADEHPPSITGYRQMSIPKSRSDP